MPGEPRRYPVKLVLQKKATMRQNKKRKLRLRFGLRFLLVFMAIVSFICYRYKQRTNFQYVANEVEKRGGAVFLRCQGPEIQSKYVVPSVIVQRYRVSLPDGSLGINARTVPADYKAPVYAFNINEFITNDSHPNFRIIDFLSGSHSDVSFGAISIPASSADQDMIRLLSRIEGLEEILLTTDYSFFEAERSERRYNQNQYGEEILAELSSTNIAEVRQATELIRVNFPNVSLYSRGLEWPYECPSPWEIGKGSFCPKCLVKYQNWQLFEPNQPHGPQSLRSSVKCKKCDYEHSFQN